MKFNTAVKSGIVLWFLWFVSGGEDPALLATAATLFFAGVGCGLVFGVADEEEWW